MLFSRIGAIALSAAVLLGAGTLGQAADDPSGFSTAQEQAVRELVRKTLMDNPEIIREVIDELQRRREQASADRQKTALVTEREELENDPHSPVYGNPRGDVTVVEFFDYQCGYCKRSFPSLMKLVKSDGNIRLVFKELPILGPRSVYATRAALAARKQGKYMEFHTALMKLRGQPTETVVKNVAQSLGIDFEKLIKDMEDSGISAIIKANQDLAGRLGVRGTPAFVIGDVLAPGALSLEDMKSVVQSARAKLSPGNAAKEKG